MFTIDEIKAAHSKVKTGADFPKYIQDLIALGVVSYDTYVADGHTDYYGANGYHQTSVAKYDKLVIADESDAEQFKFDLKSHQQGKSDYPTFCKLSAKYGVEKWIVNMPNMTCTYYDKSGKEILIEKVPS